MPPDVEPIGLPDYHLHTALCKHATGRPADFVAAARAKKIPQICFSDHCPTPDGYDEAHRMTMDQFSQYRHGVYDLAESKSPRLLLGIEADYYEGCETFLRPWLKAQAFDLVLGSVHFIQDWGFDNPKERPLWDSVDVTAVWRTYFRMLMKLADTGLFDVMSHMDLPKKFGHRPADKDLKEMVQPALDRIAAAGMGMEVNTAGLRKEVREIYPSPLILSLACEREIPICFGSDAHAPQEVGEGFAEALTLARDAGYTHYFRARNRERTLHPLPESPQHASGDAGS
jgi:histidinol-phosphatase (PHP family)